MRLPDALSGTYNDRRPPRESRVPGEAAPSRPATRVRMHGPHVLGVDSRRSNARLADLLGADASASRDGSPSQNHRALDAAAQVTRLTFLEPSRASSGPRVLAGPKWLDALQRPLARLHQWRGSS